VASAVLMLFFITIAGNWAVLAMWENDLLWAVSPYLFTHTR